MWITGTRSPRLMWRLPQRRERWWRSAIPLPMDTVQRRMEMIAGRMCWRGGCRARRASRNIGVSNQGIGGNHLLTDGLGPNALARFDRDVLAPTNVQWVIVFEGVNDLGGLARDGEVSAAEHAALVQRVIAAYQQIIARAHAHGLRVFGATITPYVGSDVLSSGSAERGRSAGGEPMDSRQRTFRRGD